MPLSTASARDAVILIRLPDKQKLFCSLLHILLGVKQQDVAVQGADKRHYVMTAGCLMSHE